MTENIAKPVTGVRRCFAGKTALRTGGGTDADIRMEILPGQGLPAGTYVECPRRVRGAHPVGTCFRMLGRVCSREGGVTFVYTHHTWPVTPIDEAEANELIAKGVLGFLR